MLLFRRRARSVPFPAGTILRSTPHTVTGNASVPCKGRDDGDSQPPGDWRQLPEQRRELTLRRRSVWLSRNNGRIRANGNLAKRLPHSALEDGSAEIERQIQAGPRSLDEADQPWRRDLEALANSPAINCALEIASRDSLVERGWDRRPRRSRRRHFSEAATRIDPSEHLADGKTDRRSSSSRSR